MAFRRGLMIGTAVGAVATLLYTPLDGRDARAVLLGPFGWREREPETETEWSPQRPPGPVDGAVARPDLGGADGA